jgi:hypothetical protein
MVAPCVARLSWRPGVRSRSSGDWEGMSLCPSSRPGRGTEPSIQGEGRRDRQGLVRKTSRQSSNGEGTVGAKGADMPLCGSVMSGAGGASSAVAVLIHSRRSRSLGGSSTRRRTRERLTARDVSASGALSTQCNHRDEFVCNAGRKQGRDA